MFFNVSMRMIFYLVDTFSASSKKEYFIKEDWRLYLSVIVCSIAGGWLGTKLFVYLKDSKDAIRGILSIFLLVCGVSLVISAFSRDNIRCCDILCIITMINLIGRATIIFPWIECNLLRNDETRPRAITINP